MLYYDPSHRRIVGIEGEVVEKYNKFFLVFYTGEFQDSLLHWIEISREKAQEIYVQSSDGFIELDCNRQPKSLFADSDEAEKFIENLNK